MNTLARLQVIFRDVFDRPELVLTPEASSNNVEGWDSFNQISLIIAIEEEFQIKFALAELDHLQNVGQMVELLDKKIGIS